MGRREECASLTQGSILSCYGVLRIDFFQLTVEPLLLRLGLTSQH